MENHARKVKRLYAICGSVLLIIFFCLICPPIISLFDRNDIWVGFMPLSQFFIVLFTFLGVLTMGVLYYFDKKYTGRGE